MTLGNTFISLFSTHVGHFSFVRYVYNVGQDRVEVTDYILTRSYLYGLIDMSLWVNGLFSFKYSLKCH